MVAPIIANEIYLSSGVPASTVFAASDDYTTRRATGVHGSTWSLPLIRCYNPNPFCLHLADVVREIA